MSDWSPPELLPSDRYLSLYPFYTDSHIASRERELSTMLEATSARTVVVDERRLRQLCSYAIPASAPAWLRYRAWSILLGVLPKDKSKWTNARTKGRTDYVALSQQILEALSSSPPPDASVSLSAKDKVLLQFSKDVEALPISIRDALSLCDIPQLDPTSARERLNLRHADAVTSRISMIKNRNRPEALSTQITPLIPTITLEDPPTSPFSPTTLYSDPSNVSASVPTVLLGTSSTTQSYENILLRLLYIHSMLHSSHAMSIGPPTALAAIFGVVLTLALQAQSTPSEQLLSPGGENDLDPLGPLLDIEADVFWMVEAIVGNTRELLGGDEGDETWARKFSNVVRWADNDLWVDLVRVLLCPKTIQLTHYQSKKGLDPALPYYSYRWIPTLFTHTLPLDTLLPIWDATFSVSKTHEGPFQHGVTPQAEFVYVIGATMLIRARAAIFQTSAVDNGMTGAHASGTASPSGLTSFWKRQVKRSSEIHLPHSPSPYSPIASPITPQSPTMSVVAPGTLDPDAQASGRLTPGRLSNIFLVAVKLLQDYDVKSFGGTERLLGGVLSLWKKWHREGCPLFDPVAFPLAPDHSSSAQGESVSQAIPIGPTANVAAGLARLRDLARKGIANEVDDDSNSPSPVEKEPQLIQGITPKLTVTAPGSENGAGVGFFSSIGAGLGSKLSESVWKGVVNQLDSPDPSPEATPEPSPIRPSMLAVHDNADPQTGTAAMSSSWSGESAFSWAKGYADKLKSSDTAANLSKTGANLRARASTIWNARRNEGRHTISSPNDVAPTHGLVPSSLTNATTRPQLGTASPATSSISSWGEMFSRRGSLPLFSSLAGDSKKRESVESEPVGDAAPRRGFPNVPKRGSYSPPAKPAHFRMARDSVMGPMFSPGHFVFSPESPHLPNSPPPTKNPLQAALAALSGSPKVDEAPKRGPKPLILNSGSLITGSGSRSGLNSRTPSRRPSPVPTPRPGDRFSLSTEGEESVINKSNFVSLRRSPLTNQHTTRYGMSSTSRDGTRSSRASTSSGVSSPGSNSQAFALDLEPEGERRGRGDPSQQAKEFLVYSETGSESRPEITRISLIDPPVLTAATAHLSSSDEGQAGDRSLEKAETTASTKVRSKRQQNRPAPITTDSPSISTNSLPELLVTTPRSGDNEPDTPRDSHELEDVTITSTPVSVARGAMLSRSRSGTRRTKRLRQGSTEKRVMHGGDNRDSTLSTGRSGSEEEGAKADVEDLDDIYDLY